MPSAKAPPGYDPNRYPPFAVTVDIVVLTVQEGRLSAAVIKRGRPPFEGAFALPGGFVKIDEDLVDAALRELAEETSLELEAGDLVQLGAYGTPGRDARMRVVSIAYVALVPDLPAPRGGGDAETAALRSVAPMLGGKVRLAFDHRRILSDAVEKVAQLVEETPAALRFCDDEFTLADLRAVYEAVWDTTIDPSNFQKRVLKTAGFVEPTGEHRLPARGKGKLAAVYRHGGADHLHPPLRRPGTYFT
jgi:8-oxo-dGTP diphosphatase